jgi:hypothetical protein
VGFYVLRNQSIPVIDRLAMLYGLLYDLHGRKPVYNSSQKMAAVLGTRDDTVRKCRKKLVEQGLLIRKKAGPTGFCYIPTVPAKDDELLSLIDEMAPGFELNWHPYGKKPSAVPIVDEPKKPRKKATSDNDPLPDDDSILSWPYLPRLTSWVARNTGLDDTPGLARKIIHALVGLYPFQDAIDTHNDARMFSAETEEHLQQVSQTALKQVMNEFLKVEVKKSPEGLFKKILDRFADDWETLPREFFEPEDHEDEGDDPYVGKPPVERSQREYAAAGDAALAAKARFPESDGWRYDLDEAPLGTRLEYVAGSPARQGEDAAFRDGPRWRRLAWPIGSPFQDVEEPPIAWRRRDASRDTRPA